MGRDVKIDWQGDWVGEIQAKLGIVTVASPDEVPKALLISRCSKTKAVGKPAAVPREFYVSPLNLAFYAYCEAVGRRYGILSDLYGLHLDTEELPFYDIHPSELTNDKLVELGKTIGKKCRERGWEKVAFYNSGPVMSLPYFLMLRASGLKSYFFTRLPAVLPAGARSFF